MTREGRQHTLSALVLVWLAAVAATGITAVHLWVLSAVLFLFFAGFYVRFGGRATPANLVTTIRTAAAVGLLVAAPFALSGWPGPGGLEELPTAATQAAGSQETLPRAYALFAAALLAALTDFVDGILARREERRLPPADEGLPRFGAVWDAETDAAFMLALSTIVFAYTPVGAWILAIGAMRYLFDLLFILLPEEPEWPRGFRRFSKTVCAVSVGTLVGALYPAVSHATAVTANSIALALLLMSFGWETVLRVGGWGMLRTLLIYYGIPLRQRRLRRLYSLFIRPGDVAFDIGAHVGNRVRAWRALGARAVAVEPQPSCLKVLRALYGRSPRIHIEPVAVGESEGSLALYICDDYPTLSTVSPDWINQVTQVETFSHINWNRRVDVPVRTLDSLIAQYGHPSFVKIDVEGHEPQVLSGLSRAVPALSFEFLPASIQGALTCIDMVEALGDYEYNYAMVETARLREPAWVSAEAMREILRRMPPTGPSGDVYARLVDENRR